MKLFYDSQYRSLGEWPPIDFPRQVTIEELKEELENTDYGMIVLDINVEDDSIIFGFWDSNY